MTFRPNIPERAFQDQVIRLAHHLRWRVAHFRPAQNSRGDWRTPVAADGKGFPDLVLVRDRVIYAELKTDRGVLRPEQRAWVEALEKAGCEVHIWRPKHWNNIVRTLGGNPDWLDRLTQEVVHP